MRPELYYLMKIAPALLALGVVCFVVGWLFATLIWSGGRRKARRIKKECDRITREMRAARRKMQ